MFILVYMAFGSLWGQGDLSPTSGHLLKAAEVGVDEEEGIRWHQSQGMFTFSFEQYGVFSWLKQIKLVLGTLWLSNHRHFIVCLGPQGLHFLWTWA